MLGETKLRLGGPIARRVSEACHIRDLWILKRVWFPDRKHGFASWLVAVDKRFRVGP